MEDFSPQKRPLRTTESFNAFAVRNAPRWALESNGPKGGEVQAPIVPSIRFLPLWVGVLPMAAYEPSEASMGDYIN